MKRNEPLEYTSQQRAAFKEAYALRLRKQLMIMALTFAAIVPLPFIKDEATYLGLSGSVLGPIAFAAVAIGWMIFYGRNWRCPACGNSLGRAFNPRQCRTCGIELRG